MKVIVSDTTPVNYLAVIGQVELLPTLFGSVLIPCAVARELTHAAAPAEARRLIEAPPAWLEIRRVADERAREVRGQTRRLGAGEIEAICLALDCRADYLLTDDRDARSSAERQYGIRVTGTLGVLELAAARKLIDLKTVVGQLAATTLRVPAAAIQALLEREASRGGGAAGEGVRDRDAPARPFEPGR